MARILTPVYVANATAASAIFSARGRLRYGIRVALGAMAVAMCWLVAGNDARAAAPPGPPGCPTPIATSHEQSTPTAIPTGPAVVTSTLEVTGAGAHLTDVDLFTDLTHSFSADLDITLQSPAGTVATITTDNGNNTDNVFAGTTFDDQADPDGQVPYVTNAGMTTDHPYANLTAATPLDPEESLAAFDGEDPNGTWTITISDDLAGDGGSLNSWRLDIQGLAAAPETNATSHEQSTPTAIPTSPAVVTSTLEVTGAGAHLSDVDLFTDLTHTYSADLDITLQSPAGTVATITTDNGAGTDNAFAGTTFDDQADPDGQVPYVTNAGVTTDHPYANVAAATPLVPEESLAVFKGEDPNGTWTITISDDLAGDSGSLNSWRLDITTSSCPPAPAGEEPPAPPATKVAPPAAKQAPAVSKKTKPAAPEGSSLRVSVARMSVFGTATARCRTTAGPVGSCQVRVRANGRVIATGASATTAAQRARVPLKLTAAGERMLASRLGGMRAKVSATSGKNTAKARTRAILKVERITTAAGTWVPNKAERTATGRRFLKSLRGRVVAVKGYRCDGHTAALESRPATNARAMALSRSRGKVVCRTLKRLGAKGKANVVPHGGAVPIASNDNDAGRAQNRRVEITLYH